MKAHQNTFDDEPTPVFETLVDLVRDPPIVVATTTPLAEVRRLLVSYRVPAIAVVDGGDRVRGILTRTDVLRADPDALAGDAMSGFVMALPARATIAKAAALIGYEGVGLVAVMEAGGALLGLVSAVDIVRYFAIYSGALPE